MRDPNTELLARMAAALGELRERLIFVGGCATSLLITDPAAENVLGFSNRWYDLALRTARIVQLPGGGLPVRLIRPDCFLATKLEAFEDRGAGDYLGSHDLEDVLSVVDGRSE